MTRFLAMSIALLVPLSCSGSAQPPPSQEHLLTAPSIAFVSQCHYPNNTKIVLMHRFGADAYHFVIRRGDENEMSRITPINDRDLDIETNGGIGKMTAVGTLFRWLLRQSFRAVRPEDFELEMARNDVVQCPGADPFLP